MKTDISPRTYLASNKTPRQHLHQKVTTIYTCVDPTPQAHPEEASCSRHTASTAGDRGDFGSNSAGAAVTSAGNSSAGAAPPVNSVYRRLELIGRGA